MSRIERFAAATLSATRAPWRGVDAVAPTDQSIGGFDADADTAFALAARDVADDLVALTAIARSVSGLTYIAVAKRRALVAILKRLDA